MADTGWVIAGAGASVAGSGEPWVNPGNITTDDGNYANASAGSKDEDTYYLKASSFGLSVPSDGTITGIGVRIKAYDSVGCTKITEVIVGKSDSTLGNDLESSFRTIASTEANYDYGGSSENWGLTWSYSDVNASTFQVRLRCNLSQNVYMPGQPGINAIFVKVYYSVPGSVQFRGYVWG